MKPPHFDEGVNGWFVDQMTKTGFYHYDPTNYHGPLHFYVLFLAQTLLGRHVWALRLPMVLASLGVIWLVLKFERFLGRPAVLWAAAAMAVSPGGVFYARYAIHEYWMVLSLLLMAWGVAGLWQSGENKVSLGGLDRRDRRGADEGDLHHPFRLLFADSAMRVGAGRRSARRQGGPRLPPRAEMDLAGHGAGGAALCGMRRCSFTRAGSWMAPLEGIVPDLSRLAAHRQDRATAMRRRGITG